MPYNPDSTLPQGQSLIYPVDANPNDFFPECIKFTVKKRDGMSLDKIVNESRASLKRLVKKTTTPGSDSHGENNILGEFFETLVDLAKKGKDIDPLEVVTNIIESGSKTGTGSEYRNDRLSIQKQNRKAMGAIYMNMPNSIQFSEAANWGSQNLGVGGDTARRAASGQSLEGTGARIGGMAAGNLGNIAGGLVGGILGKITGAMGFGMGAAAGLYGGEALQKGFESGLSIAQNPYMEMMFSGIGFRNFRFDFVLRPRHEKELETVGLIIKSFREFSRPSWNPQFAGQSFMNYPMEFDIQFLTLEKGEDKFGENFTDNVHLPVLKPCVLSNVETNFTPQSIWAAHKAGAPVAVTLGLAFTETELVMAEDIQAFDWPGPSGEYGRADAGPNPNSSEPSAVDLGGPYTGDTLHKYYFTGPNNPHA